MNNLLPKVTFFLPVYNEEKRIERCIESILKQDYPKEKIEILLIDGGSEDRTKEIASSFECVKIFDNPKRLADFGIKICMPYAKGDLFVIFAADNGLASYDWLKTISRLFLNDDQLAAVWCRMIASGDDPNINRYYELIQNDPLSFFVNKNLNSYMAGAYKQELEKDRIAYFFSVDKDKPLIWGANGLVYRTKLVKDIVVSEGFIGDNDVFQYMIEHGHNRVAYLPQLHVFHHHLRNLGDWVRKWKRNFLSHFLEQRKTRNLRWIINPGFKRKLFFWIIYSGIPVFSLIHALYLIIKDKNICWFYHPLMNFLQMITYLNLTLSKNRGRELMKELIFNKKSKRSI